MVMNKGFSSSLLPYLIVPLALSVYYYHSVDRRKQKKKEEKNNCDESSLIRPPFPPVLVDILQSSHLAYLSTVDIENASSHLSLMRYTYLEEEQVIILSTNMKTKKYTMLKQQRGVSLLVHDFDNTTSSDTNANNTSNNTNSCLSITLNGTCRIIQDGKKMEEYRDAHLKHNPEYPQFIVGPDIAILCIDVTSARICNINDEVVQWNVTDQPSCIDVDKPKSATGNNSQ